MLWMVVAALVGCGVTGEEVCADMLAVECECGVALLIDNGSYCESPAATEEGIEEECSNWGADNLEGDDRVFWECVIEGAAHECNNDAFSYCCDEAPESANCTGAE